MSAATETAQAAPLRRRWIPPVVAAVFVPLLVLALVEGALRRFWFQHEPVSAAHGEGQPGILLQPLLCHSVLSCGMVQTPRLYSIPATKAPGTVRIFVLGESGAMGDPDSTYGFSRYLEVMLRQWYPVLKFEVVNTGSVAIHLTRYNYVMLTSVYVPYTCRSASQISPTVA